MKAINSRFLAYCSTMALAIGLTGAITEARQVTIPIVADGVAGLNGSVWETEVRIFNLNGTQSPYVRRTWVATPEGGFADDPSTAPSWSFPERLAPPLGRFAQMLILVGSDLLAGAGSKIGAVGLEIDGEAEVHFRTVETGGRPRLPYFPGYNVRDCCFPGSGALVTPPEEALAGTSHLSWLSGFDVNNESSETTYRTNLALINPGPAPIDLHVFLYQLGSLNFEVPSNLNWSVIVGGGPPLVTLKPFEWRQINDLYLHSFAFGCQIDPCPDYGGIAPGVVLIIPATDDPYYAYSSIIDETTNSSMFELAMPGDAGSSTWF